MDRVQKIKKSISEKLDRVHYLYTLANREQQEEIVAWLISGINKMTKCKRTKAGLIPYDEYLAIDLCLEKSIERIEKNIAGVYSDGRNNIRA